MNIVLLCLVPVRADRVSCYGYHRDTTPNIDRLAADGTTFVSAYASAPWTPPSYSSVLTGLYPWNNGVMGAAKLAPTYPTLASVLRGAGYRTAAFVNAHHTGTHRGMETGFEEFTQIGRGNKDKGSVETTPRVLDWLDGTSRDPRPFFLTVQYHEVHHPYLPPRGHRGRYTSMAKVRGNKDLRSASHNPHLYMMGSPNPETLALLSDLYDDEVGYLDREHLGPVLTRIGDLGLLDNTIVVVVSLHGENLGDHGQLAHAASLHEPTVHVPLIIRHPNQLRGARIADLVQLTDLLPTLLKLVGVPAPERLDGIPIRAFVPSAPRRTFVAAQWCNTKGPVWHNKVREKDLAQHEFLERLSAEQFMLRVGRFKYITGPDEQLFDLGRDPGELENLAAQHPGQAAVLRAQLRRLAADRVPISVSAPPPPDVARDLRRMGYTS